jgi:hypothetical protein
MKKNSNTQISNAIVNVGKGAEVGLTGEALSKTMADILTQFGGRDIIRVLINMFP